MNHKTELVEKKKINKRMRILKKNLLFVFHIALLIFATDIGQKQIYIYRSIWTKGKNILLIDSHY